MHSRRWRNCVPVLQGTGLSAAEDLLAWQIKAAGLLPPVRQHYYARPRRLRADFGWPPQWLMPVGLLVEVQGGVYSRRAHGSITGVLADIDRLNAATLAGYRLLRVTPQMVQSGQALQLIERVLA